MPPPRPAPKKSAKTAGKSTAKRKASYPRPKKAASAEPEAPFNELVMRVAKTCGLEVPKNFPGSPGAVPGARQTLEGDRTLYGFSTGNFGIVRYYPERKTNSAQELFSGSDLGARRFLEAAEAGCKMHRDPFAKECEDYHGSVTTDEIGHSTCSFMRRADRPKRGELEFDNKWKNANMSIRGIHVNVDADNDRARRYYAVVQDSSYRFKPEFGHHVIETDKETFSEWMNANSARPGFYDNEIGKVDIYDEVFSSGVYFTDNSSDEYDAMISFYKDTYVEPGATLTWMDKVGQQIESLSRRGTKYDRFEGKNMLDALAIQLNFLHESLQYKKMGDEIAKFSREHAGSDFVKSKEAFKKLPILLERPRFAGRYGSGRKIDPDVVQSRVAQDPVVLQRVYTIEGAEEYIKDHERDGEDLAKQRKLLAGTERKLSRAKTPGDKERLESAIKDIEGAVSDLEKSPEYIEIAREAIDKIIEKSIDAADYSALSRVARQKMLEDRTWDLH